MRFTMRGVAGAALLGLLAAFAAGEDKKEDKGKGKDSVDAATFVKMAASANMAEMKAGELAQKESSNKDVQHFGAHLVKDHANAQNQLADAAKSAKIDMPKDMAEEHKKAGEKLAEHKGKKDFDAVFASEMVKGHTEAVDLYERASKSVKEEALHKYIDKTLPVVREHLEMARKLEKSVGGGKDKKDR